MANVFPIVDVPRVPLSTEQMGTKPKFWYEDGQDHRRWLFKFNRPSSGEDWSEKIASEIASLLGIPHAHVELAACEGQRGVASLDVTDHGRKGSLVHGNELLFQLDPAYPVAGFRVSAHTVANVEDALGRTHAVVPSGSGLSAQVRTAIDVFVGYLMLDALVGNTDRHHENWAVLVGEQPSTIEMAPTFDHASCLGRELGEQERTDRLETSDSGFTVEAYAAKARSALFRDARDRKPLSTLGAFEELATRHAEAKKEWRDRLDGVGDQSMVRVIQQVPPSLISETAGVFVERMLRFNRQRLLSL